MPYEILLQHVSIVPCLCVFGISHFGLYYLYSSTKFRLRFSEIDKSEQTYNLAAYLIAQLGKNFNDKAKGRITGQELLEAAIRQTQILQYQVGGMVAFVEAENKEKLLSFYENYGFKRFATFSFIRAVHCGLPFVMQKWR